MKFFFTVSCVLLAGIFLPLTADEFAYVDQGPPVEFDEAMPEHNRNGYAWVHGRWYFRQNRWLWRPGRWVAAPNGAVWKKGHWSGRDGCWHWHEGHWEKP